MNRSGKNDSLSLSMDISGVEKALKELQHNFERNLMGAAQEAAKLLEDDAKANAPWTDVTGNARKGLKGVVEKNAQGISVGLESTVDYADQLEYGQGGRRAILQPTIQKNANQVIELLVKNVLK